MLKTTSASTLFDLIQLKLDRKIQHCNTGLKVAENSCNTIRSIGRTVNPWRQSQFVISFVLSFIFFPVKYFDFFNRLCNIASICFEWDAIIAYACCLLLIFFVLCFYCCCRCVFKIIYFVGQLFHWSRVCCWLLCVGQLIRIQSRRIFPFFWCPVFYGSVLFISLCNKFNVVAAVAAVATTSAEFQSVGWLGLSFVAQRNFFLLHECFAGMVGLWTYF